MKIPTQDFTVGASISVVPNEIEVTWPIGQNASDPKYHNQLIDLVRYLVAQQLKAQENHQNQNKTMIKLVIVVLCQIKQIHLLTQVRI